MESNIRCLVHNELDTKGVEDAFEKTLDQLQKGDFRSAEAKKLTGRDFYRAKLSYADRLLFQLGRHHGTPVLLLLEIIRNHAYEKSRFLNGAKIDESKLRPVESLAHFDDAPAVALRFLHKERRHFHLLNRILSFDDEQDAVLGMRPPVIVIGSAGSGKTTLVLEKLKQLKGNVLYTTLSPYLVQNARDLYYGHHYRNDRQDVGFLSFRELIESIRVPDGRELDYRQFTTWFNNLRGATPLKDGHKVFEEFNGVILGGPVDKPYMNRDDYLALGVRRSIFNDEDRSHAYALFEKYLRYIEKNDCYDLNLEAHRCTPLCEPCYDFVVVDEVQDLTNTQLNMILQLLRTRDHFILCGDSNQIVHPNFFSWTGLKGMFYEKQKASGGRSRTIERVLVKNYRNYKRVTDLANRLLKIKNARFDRESNYLVESVAQEDGTVEFLPAKEKILRDIDKRTSRSTRTAVLVPRAEDKAAAARHFKTPLLFSIQEAKGLEYPNVILFNFVSVYRKEFETITEGIASSELETDLTYARARDKRDKSLEAYKFFVNALYVAMTRAIENLYVIEQDTRHRLYGLLDLTTVSEETAVRAEQSNLEDWKQEANRLAAQGKQEQADAIRKDILDTRDVEWQVVTNETIDDLKREALDPANYNKKAKQLLFDYAVTYHLPQYFEPLVELKFNRAREPKKHAFSIEQSYLREYRGSAIQELRHKINQYGVNFRNALNQTPLMLASRAGNVELATELVEAGADRDALDNWGQNALQIALGEAYLEGTGGVRHIGALYPLLSPSSIKIRVDKRMIKLDSHLMEFFLLQSMLAIFPRILRYKATNWFHTMPKPSFESGDFFFAVDDFPEYVLPERRKKRSYISSILSKNEYFRDDPYNRKLFLRVELGYYVLNPLMDIAVGERWVNVYDLLGIRIHAAEGLPVAEKFQSFLDEASANLDRGKAPPNLRRFFAPAMPSWDYLYKEQPF